MKKRGPKSAAELSVVQTKFIERPKPPSDLNKTEKAIWNLTVMDEVADFFRTQSMKDMLKDYCRNRCSCDLISQTIRLFEAEYLKNHKGAKRYADLIRMRENESTAAARLATKLRLTNQSRYTPKAAGTASKDSGEIKPWNMVS